MANRKENAYIFDILIGIASHLVCSELALSYASTMLCWLHWLPVTRCINTQVVHPHV